ncbi:hypothetical protein [Brachybacterium sp. NPDC056505]|uniref:hypothetical protein n=1 Tax=Brachybacterium sp. NPDC056505 TaxID=3345843 RepID=UPI00366E5BBF
MLFGGSARDRAIAALDKGLRRAVWRSGALVLTISQTSNESMRCPELISTLLDRYENVDATTRIAQPRDRAQLLDLALRDLEVPFVAAHIMRRLRRLPQVPLSPAAR